jgi:hypothetical protein
MVSCFQFSEASSAAQTAAISPSYRRFRAALCRK